MGQRMHPIQGGSEEGSLLQSKQLSSLRGLICKLKDMCECFDDSCPILVLSDLPFLSTSDRNELTGPIPDELFTITTLELLDLDNNFLTGTISPDFVNLKNLFFMTIGNNNFAGQPMPSAFAKHLNLSK